MDRCILETQYQKYLDTLSSYSIYYNDIPKTYEKFAKIWDAPKKYSQSLASILTANECIQIEQVMNNYIRDTYIKKWNSIVEKLRIQEESQRTP